MADKDFLGNAYDFLQKRLGDARQVIGKGHKDLSAYLDKNPDMRKALINSGIGAGAGILGSRILQNDPKYLLNSILGAAGANLLDVYGRHVGPPSAPEPPAVPESPVVPAPAAPKPEKAQKPRASRDAIQGIAHAAGMLYGGVPGGVGGAALGSLLLRHPRLMRGNRIPGLLLGGAGGAYLGARAGGGTADWITGYEG